MRKCSKSGHVTKDPTIVRVTHFVCATKLQDVENVTEVRNMTIVP